jgi:hypothetical protein
MKQEGACPRKAINSVLAYAPVFHVDYTGRGAQHLGMTSYGYEIEQRSYGCSRSLGSIEGLAKPEFKQGCQDCCCVGTDSTSEP